MKNFLNKILAILMVVLLGTSFAIANDKPYSVVQGTNGKMIIFDNFKEGYKYDNRVEAVSSNGRFICGGVGYSSGTALLGWVYDVKEDKINYWPHGGFVGVSDNGICVTKTAIVNLETQDTVALKGLVDQSLDIAVATNISGDGKSITGYLSSTKNQFLAIATIWGEDGKTKTLVKSPWPTSFQIKVINRDGSVFAGFGDWKIGNKQISPRSPLLWTHNGDSVYHIRDTNMTSWANWNQGGVFQTSGEFQYISPDGNTAAGFVKPKGMIWTKEKGKQLFSPPAQWEECVFMSVSGDGYAVGYFGTIVAGYNRECIVWHENMGAVNILDFARDLYGIQTPSEYTLWFPVGITTDARMLTGNTRTSTSTKAFAYVFDEQMLNTLPQKPEARQQKGTMIVEVNWQAPIYNNKDVQGYNVFCDKEKINTETVKGLSFEHTAEKGVHTYGVQAIYADGVSDTIFAKEIKVLGISECEKNEYFEAKKQYNRNLMFTWDMPGVHLHTAGELLGELRKTTSSSVATANITNTENVSTVPFKFEGAGEEVTYLKDGSKDGSKSGSDNGSKSGSSTAPKPMGAHFDLLDMHNIPVLMSYALARVGDHYYSTNYITDGIAKLDLNWNLIDVFSVEGVAKSFAITSDGEYLYVGERGNKPAIYQVDVDDKVVIRQFLAKPLRQTGGISHIAYSPNLNNGAGGFEVGLGSQSYFIDMDGNNLGDGIFLQMSSGTAYHKGYFFSAQQTGVSLCQIHVYDEKTGLPTGEYVDLADFGEVNKRFTSLVSAGISAYTTVDGVEVVGILIQNKDGNNAVVELDLFGSDKILGYNIYRNGEKLNKEPLPLRKYNDTLYYKGNYKYKVEPIFAQSCDDMKPIETEVSIDSIPPCPASKNLKNEELAENVILEWDLPATYPSASILWFNAYRNGEKLNEEPLYSAKWVDIHPGKGKHQYVVESFFENSCSSFDTATIEVTHLGSKLPVQMATVKAEKKEGSIYDAKLEWELPSYSKEFPLRWGLGNTGGQLGGEPQIAAIIGWTKGQLDLYKGYNIVGVEMLILDECTLSPLVMIDEKIVYTGTEVKGRAGESNRLMFSKPFPVGNFEKEIAVGYICKMALDKYPLAVDRGPSIVGYGDVFSYDLKEWGSLAVNGGANVNWVLAALISKPRPVDGASPAPSAEDNIQYVPINPNWRTSVATQEMKVTIHQKEVSPEFANFKAEAHTLEGFNIYRDSEKVNSELIKTTSYVDLDLDASTVSEYEYVISTVWKGGEEIKSKPIYLELGETDNESELAAGIKIYPNPAQNTIFVSGTFKKASLLNMGGTILKEIQSSNGTQIDVSKLSSGMYLLKLELENGLVTVRKVSIKR